jgi:hypothetical protein
MQQALVFGAARTIDRAAEVFLFSNSAQAYSRTFDLTQTCTSTCSTHASIKSTRAQAWPARQDLNA